MAININDMCCALMERFGSIVIIDEAQPGWDLARAESWIHELAHLIDAGENFDSIHLPVYQGALYGRSSTFGEYVGDVIRNRYDEKFWAYGEDKSAYPPMRRKTLAGDVHELRTICICLVAAERLGIHLDQWHLAHFAVARGNAAKVTGLPLKIDARKKFPSIKRKGAMLACWIGRIVREYKQRRNLDAF